MAKARKDRGWSAPQLRVTAMLDGVGGVNRIAEEEGTGRRRRGQHTRKPTGIDIRVPGGDVHVDGAH